MDAAADLLVSISAVEELAVFILKHAPEQLVQGRWQTLNQWLGAVPTDVLEKNPWLLYWRGKANMPRDLFAAREDYRRAYLLFKDRHEVSGAYLAWGAAVDSFMYLWIDFTSLDYWIDEIERLHEQFPVYPSLEIEAQVTCGMVAAAIWRRPDSSMMLEWIATAVSLLDKPIDVNTKLAMGNNALLYYLWWQGNLPRSHAVYDKLKDLGKKSHANSLVRLSWNVMDAAYLYLNGRADGAILAAHQGLELAAESGIHHMDLLLYAQAAYGHLTRFDADSALQELQGMESLLRNTDTFDFAHYHYLMTWTLLCQGQPSAALEHIRIGIKALDQMGASSYPAFAALSHAQALFECGRATEAFVAMEPARAWGQRVGNAYIEAHCQFMLALYALEQSDTAACAVHLTAALRIGKANDLPMIPWLGWRKPLLSRLLQEALILGIEPDYVRSVIKKRRLPPLDDQLVPRPLALPPQALHLGPLCGTGERQTLEVHRQEPEEASGVAEGTGGTGRAGGE